MTGFESLDVVRSLQSTTCPAGGCIKQPRRTFCGKHYYALPKAHRDALYRPIGQGYEQAVAAAMKQLGFSEMTKPAERPPQPSPKAACSRPGKGQQMTLFGSTGAREGIRR